MAKKISLNSAYGAIGNNWFRYYSNTMAEAIDTSGQLSIRWIENKINGMNNLLKTKDEFMYWHLIQTQFILHLTN